VTRPASGHGLLVGILDPASLVARDVTAVLEERGFPVAKKKLFHTSGKAEGLFAEDDDEAAFVAPATPDALEGCAIAFACGSPASTRKFLRSRAPGDGCLLVDLSGADPASPLADGRGALPEGNLVRLPDPTAWLLAELVRFLDEAAPPARVAALTVAVDRPVSELGRAALDELFAQSVALAAFGPMPKETLGGQAAFNCVHPPDSSEWEARVGIDAERLFLGRVDLSLFSARSGVFHGHHLRIEASFAEGAPPPLDAVRAALLAAGSGFEEADPEGLCGPVEAAGRDETLVLRLEEGRGRLRIALASDSLRRPAAVLAVRLAEEAVFTRGLLPDA